MKEGIHKLLKKIEYLFSGTSFFMDNICSICSQFCTVV